jgi:hypothetical protein
VIRALVLSLALSAGTPAPAVATDLVYFNVQTHKFHCTSCQWAAKCTKHCVAIPREEALKRGGVPCRVCGGTCGKPAPMHSLRPPGDAVTLAAP